MKGLIIIVLIAAIGLLLLDNNSKLADLDAASSSLAKSRQQERAQTEQLDELQGKVRTLATQNERFAAPTPTPTWIQQKLSGTPALEATPSRVNFIPN